MDSHGNPEDFNEACFACVSNSFKYCMNDKSCHAPESNSCNDFITNDLGCPTRTQCELEDVSGFMTIDKDGEFDFSKDGSFKVSVDSNEPCYLGFINKETYNMEWSISGNHVSADLLTL